MLLMWLYTRYVVLQLILEYGRKQFDMLATHFSYITSYISNQHLPSHRYRCRSNAWDISLRTDGLRFLHIWNSLVLISFWQKKNLWSETHITRRQLTFWERLLNLGLCIIKYNIINLRQGSNIIFFAFFACYSEINKIVTRNLTICTCYTLPIILYPGPITFWFLLPLLFIFYSVIAKTIIMLKRLPVHPEIYYCTSFRQFLYGIRSYYAATPGLISKVIV